MTEPTIPMLYTDWQKRVYDEYYDLDLKIRNLTTFMGTDNFKSINHVDRNMLMVQHNFMKGYAEVLMKRIERFNRVDRP